MGKSRLVRLIFWMRTRIMNALVFSFIQTETGQGSVHKVSWLHCFGCGSNLLFQEMMVDHVFFRVAMYNPTTSRQEKMIYNRIQLIKLSVQRH